MYCNRLSSSIVGIFILTNVYWEIKPFLILKTFVETPNLTVYIHLSIASRFRVTDCFIQTLTRMHPISVNFFWKFSLVVIKRLLNYFVQYGICLKYFADIISIPSKIQPVGFSGRFFLSMLTYGLPHWLIK